MDELWEEVSLKYPVRIESDGDRGFTLTSRTIALVSHGRDEAEARDNAYDAVLTALHFAAEDGSDWPEPGPAEAGDLIVTVNTIDTLKLELIRLAARQAWSVAELGRRMGYKSKTAAQRLVSFRHPTKVAELERALALFGMEPDVRIRKAAWGEAASAAAL